MKNNKIVLFDMDGTLTLPREKIQHDMIESRYDIEELCPFCGSDDVAVETEERSK
mgnify:CR=1 FL=1